MWSTAMSSAWKLHVIETRPEESASTRSSNASGERLSTISGDWEVIGSLLLRENLRTGRRGNLRSSCRLQPRRKAKYELRRTLSLRKSLRRLFAALDAYRARHGREKRPRSPPFSEAWKSPGADRRSQSPQAKRSALSSRG